MGRLPAAARRIVRRVAGPLTVFPLLAGTPPVLRYLSFGEAAGRGLTGPCPAVGLGEGVHFGFGGLAGSGVSVAGEIVALTAFAQVTGSSSTA